MSTEGELHLRAVFNAGNWIVERQDEDYGFDFDVKPFIDDVLAPVQFYVQLKSAERNLETRRIRTDRLALYLDHSCPVMIVGYSSHVGCLRYVWAHELESEFLGDNAHRLHRQQTVTVELRHHLDGDSLGAVLAEVRDRARSLGPRRERTRVEETGLAPGRPPTSVHGIGQVALQREIALHFRGFVGRKWLASQLEEWLADDHSPVLVLVGEPGLGKSAIAAWIASTRPEVAAVHFCSVRHAPGLDPAGFVASLVEQLSAHNPAYAGVVAGLEPGRRRERASDAFRELVVAAADRIAPPENRVLIVVDALDEAVYSDGETIVDVLASQTMYLPPWLRIVATTQPVPAVLDRLRCMRCLELDAEGEENLLDLRSYIADRLAAGCTSRVSDSRRLEVLAQVADLARGNFLYARMVLEALASGELGAEDLGALPRGISGYLLAAFARAFPDYESYRRDYAPILSSLAAAGDPVSFSVLRALTGADAALLHRRLRKLRAYLAVHGEGVDESYALYHRSLVGWLLGRESAGEFWCDEEVGHALLASALQSSAHDGDYRVRNLPRHLKALRRWDELAELLGDVDFLVAVRRLDEYEPRRLWATIEAESNRRAVDVYGSVVSRPERFETQGVVRVAGLLRSLGHAPSAEPLLAHVVRRFRHSGDLTELQNALNNHGLILRSLGELDAAMRLHQEQERICRSLGDERRLQSALNNQALIHMRRCEFKLALPLLREAERISRRLHLRGSLESAIFNQASIMRRRGDLDRALSRYAEAEALSREVASLSRLTNVLGAQAGILRVRGQIGAAMRLLREKEKVASEIGSPGIRSSALLGQALTMIATEDFAAASKALAEAERLSRKTGVPDSIEGVLAARARVARITGNPESALELLTERMAMCDKSRSPACRASTMGQQAFAMIDSGDLGQAELLLEQAEGICAAIGEPAITMEVLTARAALQTKQGKARDSLRSLRAVERLARRIGDLEKKGYALEERAKILEPQGSLLEALACSMEALDAARVLGAVPAVTRRAVLVRRIKKLIAGPGS